MLIKPLLELSAMYIKKAIKSDTRAIDKFERKTLRKFGVNNFIIPPSKTTGIVPIKIDFISLSFKRYLINFLSFDF